jgi:threonine/homoserine/homoserine lactone efflux protein
MLVVLSRLPFWLERGLRIAGGFFLLYLAYGIWKKWSDNKIEDTVHQQSHSVNVLQAATVNLLNPSPYLGWSLVMGPQFLLGWRNTPGSGIALVAGFYFTMIATSMAIVMIFSLTRNLGPGVKRFLPLASGLALGALGFYQLWMGIKI